MDTPQYIVCLVVLTLYVVGKRSKILKEAERLVENL